MTTLRIDALLERRKRRFPWIDPAVFEQGREYSSTFLTEFIVMASQIIVYKLAAHQLGKIGFSEYALARRTVSLMFPIPVLGLAVGLPRYIGFANGRGDHEGASRYFGATLWCVGMAALLCVFLMNFFSETFAFLFFGGRQYAYLALPLSLMVLGLCLHTVVCGHYRGHMAMNRANVLQFINLALVPIVSFLIFGRSLSAALVSIGLMSTLFAGVGLLTTPWWTISQNNLREAKELLRYGLQRVPGDFTLMALFTLPATFVAHAKGVEEAGYVAFGVTVVSLVGSVFAPVGFVLLPKATTMLGGGANTELYHHLRLILQITTAASAFIILVVGIWIPELTRLYLGSGFEGVVPVVRILILAALPYSLYLVLRNLIDAYHEYGVTAAILLASLIVFLTCTFAGKRLASVTDAVLVAFLLAVFSLAGLSGWECRRIFRSVEIGD